MFVGEDLVEAGGKFEVESLGVQGLACSNNTLVGGFILLESDASNSLPPSEMWIWPASSSHWAWERLGQLTTQWSSIPQLKQFFFPLLFSVIFPLSSFLPGMR